MFKMFRFPLKRKWYGMTLPFIVKESYTKLEHKITFYLITILHL